MKKKKPNQTKTIVGHEVVRHFGSWGIITTPKTFLVFDIPEREGIYIDFTEKEETKLIIEQQTYNSICRETTAEEENQLIENLYKELGF